MSALDPRGRKPIKPTTAKKLGLHSVTRPYLESEMWMAENALMDLRRSNIKARIVQSPADIKGAVEVWRK